MRLKTFLVGLAFGLAFALLIGATASRFPLNRAYLQSPLDGNGYSLTNVSGVTLSNGASLTSPEITNGTTTGTGFNIFAARSGSTLQFNAVTNGDSSISIHSNANTLSFRATNITEAKLLLTDVATADATSSAHGLLPKLAATTNTIPVNIGSTSTWKTVSTLLAAGSNVTLLSTSGVTTIHAAGGSGGGSVALTNSVWVAKNGSDSTGARGDPSKAFLTLGAAKTNAVSGDTIFVMPGTYDEQDLLKTGVNWHFFNGAIINYTGSTGPIFDDSGGPVISRITGQGVFTNASSSGYSVIHESDAGSDIYFECLLATAGNRAALSFYEYAIFHSAGALRVVGGQVIGWRDPAMIVGGAGSVSIENALIDGTKNGDGGYGGSSGAAIVIGGTNVTLRNCSVIGTENLGGWGSGPFSIYAGSARNITVEGTLNISTLPIHSNVTLTSGTNYIAGTVSITGNLNAPTNTAPLGLDTSDFALDTNYTNGIQRAFVQASILFSSAAATNVAQVSLYLDQDADTTFEQTGITVAQQGIGTNVVNVFGWVQPGGVFIFTNLSVGATATINSGGSQFVGQ